MEELWIHGIFAQVARLMFSRSFHLMEGIGIHPGQVALLMQLRNQDGLSQKELVERLYVKAPTVTMMIKRMERNGLLYRRQSQEDRRIFYVHITEKGLLVLEQVQKLIQQLEQESLQGFTQEEQLLFRRLLLQMRENLLKESDDKEPKNLCQSFESF